MTHGWRRWACLLLACVLVAAMTAGTAQADEKSLLERLERLEKQNEELRKKLETLAGGTPGPAPAPEEKLKKEKEAVNRQIDAYLKERDEKKKKADEKTTLEKQLAGYEVGKQLGMSGRWTNNELWFESEDKAFRLHFGGRTQVDSVWVNTPKSVTGLNSNAANPLSVGGIGKFDDAVNFRRARFAVTGQFWEVFTFDCEYDFFNTVRVVPSGNVLPGAVAATQSLNNLSGTAADRQNVINDPVPTEMWFAWNHIPFIGTIRVGNQKPPVGFEHATSSRFLDFMERSSAFDAFLENGNNGFAPGITAVNYYFDDRLQLVAGVFRPNFRDIFGWNVGDGEAEYAARIAATPIYSDGGRCVVHAALGYMHATGDEGVVRLRARTQIRNGPAVLHNTVAIIQTQGQEYDLLVPEFAANWGAWSVSAEGYLARVEQGRGQSFQNVGNQSGANLPAGGRGSLFYSGGYVTLGYFLTGESRGYDMKRKSWGRVIPSENAFAVSTDEGPQIGRGAVQVLARYSYLNLDSQDVNGGVINAMTLGINWFLCPNAKLQFNYDVGHRDATQYAGGRVAPNSGAAPGGGQTSRDGMFQAFGTRLAFDW